MPYSLSTSCSVETTRGENANSIRSARAGPDSAIELGREFGLITLLRGVGTYVCWCNMTCCRRLSRCYKRLLW